MQNNILIVITTLALSACGGGGGDINNSTAESSTLLNASQAKVDTMPMTQSQLLASPYTTIINNKAISITSNAFLNQMPVVADRIGDAGACKTPTLIVPVEMKSVPATSMSDLTVDTVYVSAAGKWWESTVNSTNVSEQIGKKTVVASGCPSVNFKANEIVQVIVKVSFGNQITYIRAPEQILFATE